MDEMQGMGAAAPAAGPDGAAPHVPFARPVYLPPVYTVPPDRLLLPDESRRMAWGDLARFAVLGIAVEILIVVVIRTLAVISFGELGEPSEALKDEFRRAMLLPTVALRSVGWITAVVLILRHRHQGPASIGLIPSRVLLDIPLGAAIVVLAYGLIALTMYTLFYLWPEVAEQMRENEQRIMAFVPRLTPWQFVFLAMLIGLYEETVFRGFLMPRFRRATGSWALAILLTTMVFTVLHSFDQTWPALIVVTILALLFSAVTIWRRSIASAIIAHALFDLSQFLGLYWLAGDKWA